MGKDPRKLNPLLQEVGKARPSEYAAATVRGSGLSTIILSTKMRGVSVILQTRPFSKALHA